MAKGTSSQLRSALILIVLAAAGCPDVGGTDYDGDGIGDAEDCGAAKGGARGASGPG